MASFSLLARYWYHGTTEDKINLILKEGLKRGMPYSDVTKECGFAPFGGVPFEEMHKTMESLVPMPVSLAKREKDAIFFACIHRREGRIPTQIILKIDICKLNPKKVEIAPLFEKKDSELRYYDTISPNAIDEVFVRKFVEEGRKLSVIENRVKPQDLQKVLHILKKSSFIVTGSKAKWKEKSAW